MTRRLAAGASALVVAGLGALANFSLPWVGVRQAGRVGWARLGRGDLLDRDPTGYELLLLNVPLAADVLLALTGILMMALPWKHPWVRQAGTAVGLVAALLLLGTGTAWGGFFLARGIDSGPTLARADWNPPLQLVTGGAAACLAWAQRDGHARAAHEWPAGAMRARALASLAFAAGLLLMPMVPHAVAASGDDRFHYDELTLEAVAARETVTDLIAATRLVLLALACVGIVHVASGKAPRTASALLALGGLVTLGLGIAMVLAVEQLPADPRPTPNLVPVFAGAGGLWSLAWPHLRSRLGRTGHAAQ